MPTDESEIARRLGQVEAFLTSLLNCGIPYVENNAAGALPFVKDCLDALSTEKETGGA